MRIAVIFTGGTIGTCVKDGWLVSDEGTRYRLLENSGYKKSDVQFTVYNPYTVLSENLSYKELNLLTAEIEKAINLDFDGIIVTHGTDTLQYSAVAAEYAFCDASVPVVFVSAAYPLDDERTNGYANFEAAVELIGAKCGGGVFVSYRNEGAKNTELYIPSSLLQHPEGSGDLSSIGQPYAVYDGNKIELNGGVLHYKKAFGRVEYAEKSHILSIDSRPGDGFAYSFEGVKAVILKPYHSATLDTANRRLADFCQRAKEKGIPVFTVNTRSGIQYDSVKAFERLGITVLTGTYVSVYMKLWAAVSLGTDIVDFIKKAQANEIDFD